MKARALVLLLALLAGACTDEDDPDVAARARRADPPTSNVVAEGSWTIARRLSDRTILVPTRGPLDSILVRHADGALERVHARVAELLLPGLPAARARTLGVGIVAIDGVDVVFSVPWSGPALIRARGEEDSLVFEEANALWSLGDRAEARRLTATRAGPFDFDTLAGMQREGVVILYWAAAPVRSPDSRTIAYATNREAVAAGSAGQSIWLLDLDRGAERALLAEPGRSYRPIGWLGAELLFIGDEPGIHAIDPATAARRRVAAGSAIDVAPDGSALAVALGAPDSFEIGVIEADGDSITIPPPPAGFGYLAQGSFSPGGQRLLLEASAQAGMVRRYFVLDRPSGAVSGLAAPPGTIVVRPEWLDDEALLVEIAQENGATRVHAVPSAPSR